MDTIKIRTFLLIEKYKKFSKVAEEQRAGIKNGSLKLDTSSGNLSIKGTVPVPATRHYGE